MVGDWVQVCLGIVQKFVCWMFVNMGVDCADVCVGIVQMYGCGLCRSMLNMWKCGWWLCVSIVGDCVEVSLF